MSQLLDRKSDMESSYSDVEISDLKSALNPMYGVAADKSPGNPNRTSVDSATTSEADELPKSLGNRHIQMIAIGGAIGSGLFIGSGESLAEGGPGNVFCAFLTMGISIYFVMQALGELAVMYPIKGSFGSYATRFISPSWGFAVSIYILFISTQKVLN
jgi:amino acid permease